MSRLLRAPAPLAQLMAHARAERYSGTLVLCFAAAPTDAPVVVFQHLRKTGGSSTRRALLTAPSVAAHLRVEGPGSEEELRPATIEAWHVKVCAALGDDALSRLVAVAGHWAQHMAFPLGGVGRDVTRVTLVREPVDRVLSRYYFGLRGSRTDPDRGRRLEPLDQLYDQFADGRADDSPVHRRSARFFNGQARELLSHRHPVDDLPFCEADAPEAADWRNRLVTELAAYQEVGVLEHLTPFLDRVFACIGSPPPPVAPHEKHNSQRPRHIDDELVATIRRYNWLDEELHRLCAARAPRTRLEVRGMVARVSDVPSPPTPKKRKGDPREPRQPREGRTPREQREPREPREPRAGRENDTRAAKDARRALKKYRTALSGATTGTPEDQARDQLLYANTLAMIDLAEAMRANSGNRS